MKTNKRCWCLLALRELLGLSLAAVCLWAAGTFATMAADTAGQPAAQQEAMKASESVTMTVKGQTSPGLAAGEQGQGGTSFTGSQVTITQGSTSGTGTLTVPLTITWQGGPKPYDATFADPSLWVSKQCGGIDATIALTNITVKYETWVPFDHDDTGTMPNTTLSMKGGNTGGPVTGTCTLPATTISLPFDVKLIKVTITATRTVTIKAH